MLDFLVLFVFPACMLAAAASDLFTMTIPNWVSGLLVAGFCAVALAAGLAPGAIALHATAGLAMLALSFAMFSLGWIGGGDAKLFAATSIWMGWGMVMPYVVFAGLFGGALCVVLLSFRLLPLPAAAQRRPWVARLHKSGNGIPYGMALAAGGLMAHAQGPWMTMLG